MRGLIMVDRSILDHPLFDKDEFSRRDAWLWMIARSTPKERHIKLVGQTVTLQRGQMTASLRFMANQFGWTVKRVRTFLDQLEADGMISRTSVLPETRNASGQPVITICNYGKYQDGEYLNDRI